jgi:hypothetical protein
MRFDRHPIWGEQAAWSFEGHAFDLTRNGRDLTLRNSPTMGNGVLALNGTNQYADTPDAPALRVDQFTIIGWVRPVSPGTAARVVAAKFGAGTLNKRSYQVAALYGTPAWQIAVSPDGGSPVTTYNFGAPASSGWHHIAATWDRTQSANLRGKFWINGVTSGLSAASNDADVLPHANDMPFSVGCQFGTSMAPGAFWAGDIGEISLYNRAWSAADIAEHFQSTRGKYL